MDEPTNYFAWCHQLECPPSACNDSVKKILRKGLSELLWDDIANLTYPAKQATVIRKNILLRKLKYDVHDNIIQCTKDLSRLKSERNELSSQISSLEEEYKQQDFLVRQKAHNLKNINSQYSLAKARKDLLEMKHSQTSTQLQDCVDMRLICQHLMPSTSTDLDPMKVREMLNMVMSLYSGANKKQVWDTISTTLDNIETSILWSHMYQNLSEDTDRLMKLEAMKTIDSRNSEETIDIGIAKACAQHLCIVSKCLFHETKANKYQENVLECIKRIEAASANCTDITEWLATALEVRKLEVEQMTLQNEIDQLQEEINQNNTLVFDLIQLTSDIQKIDVETEEYVRDIQQSLALLKSAPNLISKMKEKLYMELQTIMGIRAGEYDYSWLKDDLDTEIDLFFDTLDLSALRKIMLKGDVGRYRHTKCCFDEASVSVTPFQGSNLISHFPMIQIPIYSLVECYKNLSAMFIYKKFSGSLTDEAVDQHETPGLVQEKNNYNTVDLLNLTTVICDKTKEEIDQFNEILSAWVNQTAQEAMKIIETNVDDVSFPDWVQRYSLLLYMIQNTAQ